MGIDSKLLFQRAEGTVVLAVQFDRDAIVIEDESLPGAGGRVGQKRAPGGGCAGVDGERKTTVQCAKSL